MESNTAIFFSEVKAHCERLGQYQFDFVVEMWGFLWTPWYVFIGNETLDFSINEIHSSDLKDLVDAGKLLLIKDFTQDELSDPEIERVTFELVRD